MGSKKKAGPRKKVAKKNKSVTKVPNKKRKASNEVAKTETATNQELNDKQILFCHEYLKDLNATQAYMRAYPDSSEAAARASASELLTNPNIVALVATLNKERLERVIGDADEVLREVFRLARQDIGAIFDDTGLPKSIHELPEEVRRTISKVEFDKCKQYNEETGEWDYVPYIKKIHFWDKVKALELLGKHFKLFTEKLEVEGKLTLEDLVMGSNEGKGDK